MAKSVNGIHLGVVTVTLLSALTLSGCGTAGTAPESAPIASTAPVDSLVTAAELGPGWALEATDYVLGKDKFIFGGIDCNGELTPFVDRSSALASAQFYRDGRYDRGIYQQIFDLPTAADAEAFLSVAKKNSVAGPCDYKSQLFRFDTSVNAKAVTNLPTGATGYTWVHWQQMYSPDCKEDLDSEHNVWVITHGNRVYVTVTEWSKCVEASDPTGSYAELKTLGQTSAFASLAK